MQRFVRGRLIVPLVAPGAVRGEGCGPVYGGGALVISYSGGPVAGSVGQPGARGESGHRAAVGGR